MFETSHIGARAVAQRRYGLLTVSLALHSAVIVAVVVATVSSVSLPTRAPNELPAFRNELPVVIPPPVGSRTAPRVVARAAVSPPVRTAPQLVTAPDRIPDTVPTPGPATGDSNPGATGPVGAVPYGDPNGVPGGLDTGENIPAVPATATVPTIYKPGGEVRAPVVLRRVDPLYPRAALMSHLSGVVVLECVIDKDGRIRDEHVVRSSMSIFDEPALQALRQWQFAPGALRGNPVDTWFQLTVAFQPR